jgi:TonB family protein
VRDTRTLKGFLLSFIFHLIIFLLFFLSFEELKIIPPSSSKQDKKITLNLSQFTPPAPQPKPRPKVTPPQQKSVPTPPVTPPKPVEKPVIKKPEVKPEPPKPVAEKKVVEEKKSIRVAKKAEKDNNVTKVVKKEPKKEVKKEKKKLAKAKPKKRVHKKKKKIAKKKPLPTTFRLPKKHSKDKLANTLLGGSGRSASRSRPSHSGKPSRIIQQLYGREFYSFTKTQQKFIKDHLSEIHRITQNTLVMNGYPDVAVRTGQQGTNVVSFYLHPNGDISNLRLVKRMGYEALDKNTISVIQIAYKDYPRPKTKTKIVFYVNYSLY